MVDALINDYKEYLSGEQMVYLEAIRGNRLNLFFRSYEKSKGTVNTLIYSLKRYCSRNIGCLSCCIIVCVK